MYDVGGKLFNGIKIMYVNSLVCVRVKGGESEYFRIKSGVPFAVQCIEDAVMTWFCVTSWRMTRGQWWDIFLRCVGEEV